MVSWSVARSVDELELMMVAKMVVALWGAQWVVETAAVTAAVLVDARAVWWAAELDIASAVDWASC